MYSQYTTGKSTIKENKNEKKQPDRCKLATEKSNNQPMECPKPKDVADKTSNQEKEIEKPDGTSACASKKDQNIEATTKNRSAKGSERILRRRSTLDQTKKLTDTQRELIKVTFEKMEEEGTRTGMSIFVRLFSDYPNYKNIWPQFRAYTDSSLMGSSELKRHADVYMGGLKTVISALDDDDKLAETLKKIATAHLKWGIRQFHIENMLPEVLATIKVYLDALTPEVEDAWRTLFCVIAVLVEQFRVEQYEIDMKQKQKDGGSK